MPELLEPGNVPWVPAPSPNEEENMQCSLGVLSLVLLNALAMLCSITFHAIVQHPHHVTPFLPFSLTIERLAMTCLLNARDLPICDVHCLNPTPSFCISDAVSCVVPSSHHHVHHAVGSVCLVQVSYRLIYDQSPTLTIGLISGCGTASNFSN